MENKFKEFGMSDTEWNERLATLTKKQLLYFQIMIPNAGVLYIQSKPGVAKSATARAIAEKMGMQYMDIRLSMVDETDVGLYPSVGEMSMVIDGKDAMVKVLSHVVPEWAVKANQAPTVIHFEELNRASLHVRNAALQLLLEREIGINFKFNENVLMLSSGNLGEEDGTDVEEFDNALNNRLIAFKHSLAYGEWVEDFAKFHICPTILSFLNANPEKLYVDPTENCLSYATPRSWTFLSQFIFANFGSYVNDEKGEPVLDERGNHKKNYGSAKQWLSSVSQVGRSYLGDTITKFVRYCEENINVSIWDILDKYKELESEIKDFNRDRKSELLVNLKELKIEDLKPKQIDNAAKFLKMIDADERTGYLLHMLDNKDVNESQTKRLLLGFKEELKKIRKQNKQED